MNAKSVWLFLTLFCAGGILFAGEAGKILRKSIFVRSGEILAAEYCGTKPTIENASMLTKNRSDRYYVQVVLRPDKGRSLSVHDYTLQSVSSGKEFDCIAIAEGKDSYHGINWVFRDLNGTTAYRLLFTVPSGEGEFQLVFKLFDSKIKGGNFLLKDASSGFTPVSEKMMKGMLRLPKPPEPPKPAPAEDYKGGKAADDKTSGGKAASDAKKAPGPDKAAAKGKK